jgi:uncharacterized protein (TIGR03435 family)
MKRLWLFAFAILSAGMPVWSQARFEAASIRPLPPREATRLNGGPGTSDPGHIEFRASLQYLVMAAYRVGGFQISGPSWLTDQKFEITAKLPPGASGQQLHEMLQQLLRERFHLAFHQEKRTMQLSILTVSRDGPKLQESKNPKPEIADNFDLPPTGPPNQLETDREGYPIVPPNEGTWLFALRSGRARTHQLNASMDDLAVILSTQLGRPVTDATNLTGRYDFTLSWMSGVSTDAGDAGPDLATALRQQLGLQLESSKGPVDVLIIDGIEKDPTPN